jgi:hypothetical protein
MKSSLAKLYCLPMTLFFLFLVCKNDNRELNLNNASLMLRSVILLIVSLFLLVTLVKLVVVVIRNNNDDNVDTMDEIMLISVPREENQTIVASIKESLESYLKKTMVSSKNIENQFCVKLIMLFTSKKSFQETPTKSCAVGLESKNIKKNKDRTYIPCSVYNFIIINNQLRKYNTFSDDSTRVILQPLKEMGTDDYINATYINVRT